MIPKDEIFNQVIIRSSDFTFNQSVAKVFDDMVTRSVPYYPEMQRMIGELAGEHYQEKYNSLLPGLFHRSNPDTDGPNHSC